MILNSAKKQISDEEKLRKWCQATSSEYWCNHAKNDLESGKVSELGWHLVGCLMKHRERSPIYNGGLKKWNSGLWIFFYYAKSHPELNKLSGEDAYTVIQKHFEQWPHEEAPYKDWWEKYFGIKDSEASCHIEAQWDKVEATYNKSRLNLAFEDAKKRPIYYRSKLPMRQYILFLSLGYWLQRRQKAEPILLPVKKLAHMMDTTTSFISILRKKAIKEEYLKEVGESSYSERRATQFLFNLPKAKLQEEIDEFMKGFTGKEDETPQK